MADLQNMIETGELLKVAIVMIFQKKISFTQYIIKSAPPER